MLQMYFKSPSCQADSKKFKIAELHPVVMQSGAFFCLGIR